MGHRIMADTNRLSAARVASALAPGLYGDGGGLWLRVADGGSKSWVFRYRSRRDGRERRMGLGSLRTWSLAEARERARECRQLLDQTEPKDPIEQRRAARARLKEEAARLITFQQCAELYLASHGRSWRSARHSAQWTSTLKDFVYPVIGAIPVSVIDTPLVLKVIEPVWQKKTETASRVRNRIEAILDWASVRGHRKGENPARWRGHLQKMLPARSKLAPVKHHAALPYAQVPAFIAGLQACKGTAPQALEFIVLTAARRGEVIGVRWPEIDVATQTWTVPAERMKSGREHKVPLSARALNILAGLPREKRQDGYVFVGARSGRPLSNMAMSRILRRMNFADLTVHGFRSSFRDWAAEQTNFAREVAEAALAHAVGDKVEAAYRRGDLFKKRAALMEAWAKYCARPASAAPENVVKLRALG
jgi:integrase